MTFSHQMVRPFLLEQIYRAMTILKRTISSRIMKIVFATNNPNKLAEIRQLMPEGIEILSFERYQLLGGIT